LYLLLRFLHARDSHLRMNGIDILCATGHHKYPANPPPRSRQSLSNEQSADDSDKSDVDEQEKEEDEDERFEPYTSERLDRVPGGFSLLSEITKILEVHFYDPMVNFLNYFS
jgi:hypothetical protein